jgi:hypothetical protein
VKEDPASRPPLVARSGVEGLPDLQRQAVGPPSARQLRRIRWKRRVARRGLVEGSQRRERTEVWTSYRFTAGTRVSRDVPPDHAHHQALCPRGACAPWPTRSIAWMARRNSDTRGDLVGGGFGNSGRVEAGGGRRRAAGNRPTCAPSASPPDHARAPPSADRRDQTTRHREAALMFSPRCPGHPSCSRQSYGCRAPEAVAWPKSGGRRVRARLVPA